MEGFRLSPQQRHLWRDSDGGMRPWSRAACALEIHGALDRDALCRAARRLVARHEILRTTFHKRSGGRWPFQVLSEDADASWSLTEGAAEPATDPLAAARGLARQESVAPFDLERGPLFRMRLSRLSPSTHVLFFTLPALCADRRSVETLARELVIAYAEPGFAGAAPIQYADYSEWQNEMVEAVDAPARQARAHWNRTPPAAESLPFRNIRDEPAPARATELRIEAEQLAALESVCHAEGCSPADFLLTCWQVLLSRTTAEAEVLVREVFDGRKLEDLSAAVGLFARPLPIAASFEDDPPFRRALRRTALVRACNAEWQEYFGTPEDLEASSGLPARAPGFELFERPELPDGGGVSFRWLAASSGVGYSPLSLTCRRGPEGLAIACAADPDSLSRRASDRLTAHLATLLEAAAKDPTTRTGALPILAPRERRRVLTEWNRTAAPFPRTRRIHELFEEQVGRTPEAPAVVFGEQRLTYAQLNDRANALAGALIERGAGRNARVGLALERSADVIVAVLAILKAGAAYVPLDPEHPAPRLAAELSQSESRILVTRAASLKKRLDFAGEILCVDREPSLEGRGPTRNPQRPGLATDLVYVMHTSGSTGIPKAVAVRHESLVNYSECILRDLLRIDPAAGSALAFASVSAISADLGNTSVFPALLSGGCLHVVGSETAMEGGFFSDYFSRNPIDVLKIVPSHLAALLASGAGRDALPRRFLILGGEALRWELVERIRRLGGSCEIVNHYGPTETTVGSLVYRVAADDPPGPSPTVPIGHPVANTEVFILDGAHEPVPIGVPGELCIGGIGLADGYCLAPAETAERFVPTGFSGAAGTRLYRTGDRARRLATGEIEFLGRLDDQIKLRGFRIEPGEIEVALSAHPEVAESVVTAPAEPSGERRIVAYVVPAAGASPSADALRGWVKDRLPEFMAPTTIVGMKALPRKANGKIDRRALPPPEETGTKRPHVPPRTPGEAVIAGIWQDVLRVPQVGAEDNIFDLGGNSLLVAQAAWRIRQALERELPIRWLFESPTVEQLAARFAEAEREEIAQLLDELEPAPEEDVVRMPSRK